MQTWWWEPRRCCASRRLGRNWRWRILSSATAIRAWRLITERIRCWQDWSVPRPDESCSGLAWQEWWGPHFWRCIYSLAYWNYRIRVGYCFEYCIISSSLGSFPCSFRISCCVLRWNTLKGLCIPLQDWRNGCFMVLDALSWILLVHILCSIVHGCTWMLLALPQIALGWIPKQILQGQWLQIYAFLVRKRFKGWDEEKMMAQGKLAAFINGISNLDLL